MKLPVFLTEFARRHYGLLIAAVIVGVVTLGGFALADPLPSTPTSTSSTMYTLTEVYQAIAGEIGELSSTTIATGTSAFGIDGTLYPSGLLVTGQTACYDVSGNSISCSGTTHDGDVQAGRARSYTDNGDGTVLDNNTGLTWQKGYSTSTMTWTAATSSCATNEPNLPGSGWRLPNVKELITLVDYGISATVKIDTTAFPGSPASYFWSATTYPWSSYQHYAMTLDFGDGSVSGYNKTSHFYVRCVRD